MLINILSICSDEETHPQTKVIEQQEGEALLNDLEEQERLRKIEVRTRLQKKIVAIGKMAKYSRIDTKLMKNYPFCWCFLRFSFFGLAD